MEFQQVAADIAKAMPIGFCGLIVMFAAREVTVGLL